MGKTYRKLDKKAKRKLKDQRRQKTRKLEEAYVSSDATYVQREKRER